jgi:hypothetical protein
MKELIYWRLKMQSKKFEFPEYLSDRIANYLLFALNTKKQQDDTDRKIHDCLAWYMNSPMKYGLVKEDELKDSIVIG